MVFTEHQMQNIMDTDQPMSLDLLLELGLSYLLQLISPAVTS